MILILRIKTSFLQAIGGCFAPYLVVLALRAGRDRCCVPPRVAVVAIGNVGQSLSPRLRPPIVPVVPMVLAALVVSIMTVAGMLPVTIHLVAVPIVIAHLIVAGVSHLAAIHRAPIVRVPVLPSAHLVTRTHASTTHAPSGAMASAHAAAVPLRQRLGWNNCQQEQS